MKETKVAHKQSAGFSLVATVTLMILLTLIAVALLSLSTSTLRGSRNGADFREAQANARLALQMALAQLQETMGPDQAVSAPAETIFPDTQQPHLVGAWNSWSWDPTQDNNAPNYTSEKAERFKGWLTSQILLEDESDLGFGSSAVTGDTVRMLGEGTFGTSTAEPEIRAQRLTLEDENEQSMGQIAWTVLAEDTKARLDLVQNEERPFDSAHLTAGLTFPERSHRDALEIGEYDPENEEDWSKLLTLKSLDAAAGVGGMNAPSQEHFFDVTTHSRGVLSDVVNGGLKRDLTTILEENLLDGTRVYSGNRAPFGVADPHWSYLSDYYNQYLNFQGADATTPVDVTGNLAQVDVSARDSSPSALTLKPVIAKMQIVFSMVTHPIGLSKVNGGGHESAYSMADPNFAGTHLRAWLAFEPVVTLWNPYSVPIQFSSMSIGLDKLPLGFRFGKQAGRTAATDIRVIETQSSRINRSFWPLSNFVWFGNKTNAITNFSFNIRGGNMSSGLTRDPITLQPGENKVFSIFVEEGASFGDVANDFLIQSSGDVGSSNGGSLIKDVDMVEGFNNVGGFRFDHLGRNNANRTTSTLYSFERENISQGWYHFVILRPTDSIVVKAKLANNDAETDDEEESRDDFTMLVEMDQLGGIDSNQTLGSSFTVREKERLYEEGDTDTIIERSFPAGTIVQNEGDTDQGGKTPFAVFTMTAKTSQDLQSPTKGWLFGNPVLSSYEQDEDEAPQPVQSYEFSFREVTSANSFPMVEIDPETNRGYFGPGQSAQTGLTASPMFTLPTSPMVSIGQFQAANLISAVRPPFFNYPLGNSFAHPLLQTNQAVAGSFVDHSYLLNQRLWDSFYFSGISKGMNEDNTEALTNFFEGRNTLTPRLQPNLGRGEDIDEIISDLSENPEMASRELAGHQMLEGAFNVHSTSVLAWKALLMSAFELSVPTRDNDSHMVSQTTPFTRLLPSYSESNDDLTFAAGSGDIGNDALRRAERWLGFHELTEEQCELLAENIVEQIQLRCAQDEGPFLSFGEFVNRRIGGTTDNFVLSGVLQDAIDLTNDPNLNSDQAGIGDEGVLFSLEDGVGIVDVDPRVPNPDALIGNTAEGSPATLIQGDLLQQIGSVISVRSDTFRVRSYGNSVDQNGRVKAEVWCEAIVQRMPDFVDSSQSPGTEFDDLNVVNQNFGRRFQVVSFRWLDAQEV